MGSITLSHPLQSSPIGTIRTAERRGAVEEAMLRHTAVRKRGSQEPTLAWSPLKEEAPEATSAGATSKAHRRRGRQALTADSALRRICIACHTHAMPCRVIPACSPALPRP